MKLMIHGGFFSEASTSSHTKLLKQQSLARIAQAAGQYLQEHTAMETCVFAVSMLEDDPLFNAGTGSQIQADGQIRLSAAIMDGETQKISGVINTQYLQNPVQVAWLLQEYADRILSGSEARNFAYEQGFSYYNPQVPQRLHEYINKLNAHNNTGTVGCVALDGYGRLAAATSTGGKGFEIPGRVSDSATPAGNYATRYAAVSCTGVGEDIMAQCLAAKIVTRVTDGFTLRQATDKSFNELAETDGFAGVIGITAQGEMYHTCSHPYMVWASYNGSVNVFQ